MIEFKSKVRTWGRSLGIVIPREGIIKEKIQPNDIVEIIVKKNMNSIEKTFGTLKFSKSTTEILKEVDEELWNED
ncbi:MAG: AbrB/MazE/SpoVT family DNA-binding domain-containing protein [Candidatus Aenigmarchaeota archaeon]|nr:AbrB/MazE/SpoVT family DNA-binding domain-containing protein [Candidatus Aenigmarchaeota archaeon]